MAAARSTLTRAVSHRPRARPVEALALTPDLFEEFLESLAENGRTRETVTTYRRGLNRLYEYLPEEKCLRQGTLETWREELLAQGYAHQTINCCVAAANSLLEYCGRRELQLGKPLGRSAAIQPELTRNEYLRLLSTARTLGKERTYLLIKVFGSVGLTIHQLPSLTREAAEAGKLVFPTAVLHIPACLREELLDYADRKGILTGPLFVTRNGKPMNRTNVTGTVQALCRDARVAEEKGNPRCLRRLYQNTQAGIQSNIALLVEQAHDRLLETEQLVIGWREDGSA